MSLDYQLEVDFPLHLEPLVALYQQLDEDYPDLYLTRSNSSVTRVEHSPAPAKPGRSFLTVTHNDGTVYRFQYLRLLLGHILSERLFLELPNQPIGTDILLSTINERFGLQITSKDVFVSQQTTKQSGGSEPYNYRLKARGESLVWVGQVIVSTGSHDALPVYLKGVPARRQAITDTWTTAYRPKHEGDPYRDDLFYLGKVIRDGFLHSETLSGNAVIEYLDTLHASVASAVK